MSTMYNQVLDLLQEGKSLALVSIIKAQGSVPRGAGAQMIVLEDGTSFGTIGGGKIEFRSISDAQTYIKEKRSYLEKFRLDPHSEGNLGMTCGGNADVLFHYIEPSDASISLMSRIVEDSKVDKNSWVITKVGSMDDIVIETVFDNEYEVEFSRSTRCELVEQDNKLYYIEPLNIASKTYVFGGGHVAQATIPLLQMLGFQCVIIEDRKELLDSLDYGDSVTKIYKEYSDIAEIGVNENDYVISLSRGHATDLEVLKVMLGRHPKYIGMMGSRSKVAIITKELKEFGYSEEDLSNLYSPIGLDIKASDPTEIGLSIVAQMVLVRNSK